MYCMFYESSYVNKENHAAFPTAGVSGYAFHHVSVPLADSAKAAARVSHPNLIFYAPEISPRRSDYWLWLIMVVIFFPDAV